MRATVINELCTMYVQVLQVCFLPLNSFINDMSKCSQVLQLCQDSHQLDISLLLSKHLPQNWEELLTNVCQPSPQPQPQPQPRSSMRSRREAKKRGGSGRSRSSSIGRGISRTVSTIRRTGGSVLRNRGGGRARVAASAAAGAAAKRGKKGKGLRKFGKYAVAGLAGKS